MKPRLFIGSSVEGLDAAYALQEVLEYDTECTVWTQGIFDLSSTNIESLDETIRDHDFGVFIFHPDDEVEMRGEKIRSVRDNVLFEMGLMIGRLGRERVFFVLPENSDVHIPSDLLGVVAGKFKTDRQDGNLVAALGSIGTQIRRSIRRLGPISGKEHNQESDLPLAEESEDDDTYWISDIINKEYDEAERKLKDKAAKASGDDLIDIEGWLLYIKLMKNPHDGTGLFDEFISKNNHSECVYVVAAQMLNLAGHDKRSFETAEKGLEVFAKSPQLISIMADYHKKSKGNEEAIAFLKEHESIKDPANAILMAEYLEDSPLEVISTLDKAYKNFPTDNRVTFCYAKALLDNGFYEEAMHLLNLLTIRSKEVVSYWGYLSNACVKANLSNLAMRMCKKANKLADEKQSWLLSNIGNIYNNMKLFDEASEYLKKSVAIDSVNTYAYERLASVSTSIEEEDRLYQKACQEGKRKIMQRNSKM